MSEDKGGLRPEGEAMAHNQTGEPELVLRLVPRWDAELRRWIWDTGWIGEQPKEESE